MQLNHQIDLTIGVMQQECSHLLSSFFKRRRAEKKALKNANKDVNTTINHSKN